MLEPAVTTRIREYIAAELGPRDRTLGMTLMHAQQAAAVKGQTGSSRLMLQYGQIGRNELSVRGGIIWTAIHRSYSSLVRTASSTALDDLRLTLAGHLQEQVQAVAAICLTRAGDRQEYRRLIEKEVHEHRRELLARLDVEVQFYLDGLKNAPATGNSIVNIHGPVGAVQTGAYATANLSLAGPDGIRLIEALTGFQNAINQNTEISAEARAQGLELTADVIRAARSEKPNVPKVGGLLSGLATTVQTVASMRGAWQLVRDAAAAVGMPLP